MNENEISADIEDMIEEFWLSEDEAEDTCVASFVTDWHGAEYIGITHRNGWLIAYSVCDESGAEILGAWPPTQHDAHQAALKACDRACDPCLGYWISTELRDFAESNGTAPWMTDHLVQVLADYEPAALAHALHEEDVALTSLPDPAELIRQFRQGTPPRTDHERAFAWELTTAIGIAEHQGRRIGEPCE
jgi:hypothetical protein